jgi:2-polyprenyl-6-methoxyphenol hydroxylase-like FAD-dependent oxidoreductase
MAERIATTCVISGGGPAGMLTGYLLARAGIDVHVLEKHADFLRDFRGDTIHPSTLEVLDELGLGEAFDALPHNRVYELSAAFGRESFRVVDFRRLGCRRDYVAFIPQWDFLEFLADQAGSFPNFHLHMATEATGLVEDGDHIAGLEAMGPQGDIRIEAALTIAADGRTSRLRDQSGLALRELGAPMDVFWFKLDKPAGAGEEPLARVLPGKIFIALDRATYWQCGYVVPKGRGEELKERAFGAVMEELAGELPDLAASLRGLAGWDEFKLLSVSVNRLKTWWLDGFLAIGDAAHAMSPVGGVGINIAIQDAVAVGNMLVPGLRAGRVAPQTLAAFQKRRFFAASATQALQIFLQKRIISNALAADEVMAVPLFARLADRFPFLRGLPARIIGRGVRPEHVDLAVIDGRG